MIKKIITILIIISFTACTTNYGRFSAISTGNIRGLEYDGERRSQLKIVEGKSCFHDIQVMEVVVALLTVGISLFIWDGLEIGETDLRIERAVKKAIDKGIESGIYDADMLVDVIIDGKRKGLPLVYIYNCIEAKGRAVSSETRKQ